MNTNKNMTNGDVLPVLYKAGIKALVTPITSIYNQVSRTGTWPKRWTKENSYIKEKIPVPLSLEDVRVISKSPLLCTQFEKIVIKWLLNIVEPQIDLGQFGAKKWASVTHLMIELMTFIHYNLDLRKRHAVTLTMVDYAKAFNRQDHNLFLTILHSMNVPG